ncbi:MAG: tetratricopeptide repeat protein [Elusimicrobia bacterium]|nr:tetratricopeptide repeat protein [Elusimicrobiota bacterium]
MLLQHFIPKIFRLFKRHSLVIPLLLFSAFAIAQQSALSEDEALFQSLSRFYRDAADRTAVIDAFDEFIKTYPQSPRAPDAQFMKGEAYMAKGLELKARAAKPAKTSPGASSPAAVELNNAVKAYLDLIDDYNQSGLEASAQYRIGEAFYNMGDWRRAIKEFARVGKKYPKSYAVPESLLGIIYSDIALNDFPAARTVMARLKGTYPPYADDPAAVFAKAVLELDDKNYPAGQELFSRLDTPEARFFLGKAYIYEGKTYIAAGVFEALLKDYPATELKEEVKFLGADSFFYARDYDGAIVKYQDFIKDHPSSKLKNAAVFRIGAALFNKKEYADAQANFQNIIDRSPRDPFAPLAQYFIAESYLADKQTQNALFAYTKLADNYPASSVAPAARYKLAWCRYLLGDHLQAARALENFPALHPGHALAKNALYLAGNAWLALAHPADAVRAFQSALDLAPSSEIAETALFMSVKAEYERGNYNNILTSYQFIFKSLPPAVSKWRALSLLYVAEAYLALNFIAEARNLYNDIVLNYPNDAAAIYAGEGLVWCYALAGDPEAAVKTAEKLKALAANFPGFRPPEGASAMAIADSYFNRKEFEPAYQLYEKFAAENAKSASAAAALYRAGLALYRLRYYSQAVELWTKLSANYPSAPETEPADFQSADTWFRAQKYTEALGAYNALIAKYPRSAQIPLAYLRLAQIHYNLNADAPALEQAQAVVKNFPGSAEAFDALDLAEALFDRNSSLDFKSFLLNLAGAKPRNKASGEALFRLGRRLFERKDYTGAAANLKKFSVEYIDHASVKDAQFYLGEAEFQNGDMRNAASVFNRFTANYPRAKEHPLALLRLGNASFNLKRYRGAATAYAKLAELYPDNEYIKPALFNLALAYKNTGAADKAEETYRKYYTLSAGSADGLAALWEIFNMRKNKADPAGALDILTEIYGATRGQEDALEALYQLGAVSLENRQTEEARGYWEKLALQKPAGSAWRLQGLVKLGELYEGEKNYGEAARVYEDIAANASAPDVAKAAAGRAKSLKAMVQKEAPAKGGQTSQP